VEREGHAVLRSDTPSIETVLLLAKKALRGLNDSPGTRRRRTAEPPTRSLAR
jgi:hypothetical protein